MGGVRSANGGWSLCGPVTNRRLVLSVTWQLQEAPADPPGTLLPENKWLWKRNRLMDELMVWLGNFETSRLSVLQSWLWCNDCLEVEPPRTCSGPSMGRILARRSYQTILMRLVQVVIGSAPRKMGWGRKKNGDAWADTHTSISSFVLASSVIRECWLSEPFNSADKSQQSRPGSRLPLIETNTRQPSVASPQQDRRMTAGQLSTSYRPFTDKMTSHVSNF